MRVAGVAHGALEGFGLDRTTSRLPRVTAVYSRLRWSIT